MIQFQKILFPTDFSTCAAVAQKYAFDLARQCKAKLYVIHVVPNISFLGDSEVFHMHVPDVSAEMHKSAHEQLEAIVPKSLSDEIEVEFCVLDGDPFREILSFAKDHKVDLMVIATHGRSGLQHLLLGGTSDKVIRQAPCPVMIVRHPDRGQVVSE